MELSLNFRYLLHTFFIGIILTTLGCLTIESEWEELESDFDHVLNVLGIINLDSNQPSFIGLYRTTDLDEVSQILVDIDTVGYYEYGDEEKGNPDNEGETGFWIIDSIYEPAAMIKDASIIITDHEGVNYEFSFVDKVTFIDTIYIDTTFNFYGYTINWDTTIYDTNDYRINFYLDTTGTFMPQPGVRYELNITAPGFDSVTGSLTTPITPKIDSLVQNGVRADTIISSEPFDIYWNFQNDGQGFLSGEIIFEDGNGFDSTRYDWCGGFFEGAVDLSDSSYTVYGDWCEDSPNVIEPKDYYIRLTAMDENYYEYFIEGEIGEYSNMLLNYPTTKGRSVGIEGGFGFFGAITSDGIYRLIVP